jgi:hypothetical protein
MKVCSGLLCLAPVTMAFLTTSLAFSQDNSPAPLHTGPLDSPASYAPGSFSYRLTGLVGSRSAGSARLAPVNNSELPAIQPPGFYPMDVSNPANGATVVFTQHHPIYVNKNPSHWGDVATFLTDLGRSQFIHLLDQYVGVSANNRYTLGTQFLANYPIPSNHTLGINDILALVHAGASAKGNGYSHIYHTFLPSGVDMCIDAQTCYSPDNNAAWVFCAFHGSVTFSDIGHVLFSVEPYQNVIGCAAPPQGTANSQLIDSTNDTLSHETFETISDPDDAWWVRAFTFAYGEEIGDVCTRAATFNHHLYSYYGNITMNGHLYTVQPEYSNQGHGCAYGLLND